MNKCRIAANIATDESLTAVFGDGGVGDVTETFGKGPRWGACAGLAWKFATVRRFVAEQQFISNPPRQIGGNIAVSNAPLTELSSTVCTGLSTSKMG